MARHPATCPNCGEKTLQLESIEYGNWPIRADGESWELDPFEVVDTFENTGITCRNCEWETSTSDPDNIADEDDA
jgi:hypothetical protein